MLKLYLIVSNLTLLCVALPHPALPCFTSPHFTLPYLYLTCTLLYLILPYLTLPYLTSPHHLTSPYLTIPCIYECPQICLQTVGGKQGIMLGTYFLEWSIRQYPNPYQIFYMSLNIEVFLLHMPVAMVTDAGKMEWGQWGELFTKYEMWCF